MGDENYAQLMDDFIKSVTDEYQLSTSVWTPIKVRILM